MEHGNTVMAGLGAGMIGASWAVAFAGHGWQVALYDPFPASITRGLDAIDRALATLAGAGALDDPAAARQRIRVATSLADALRDAVYVQESATEDLELKAHLFAEADALARPEAILASSTSEFPGSRFLEAVPGRARCLVVHPLNPPHLIPAVELCPAPWTAPETVTLARSLLEGIGKACVTVQREVPGFVMNRLQVAVIMEALHLVAEGYCSPQDLDVAMRLGLGLRWTAMGPFETNHLATDGGYRTFIEHYWPTLQHIAEDLMIPFPADAALAGRVHDAVEAAFGGGDITAIEARRDRNLLNLAAVMAHK
jgi:3-hydroxyacyl-CoA dehydrogenase